MTDQATMTRQDWAQFAVTAMCEALDKAGCPGGLTVLLIMADGVGLSVMGSTGPEGILSLLDGAREHIEEHMDEGETFKPRRG